MRKIFRAKTGTKIIEDYYFKVIYLSRIFDFFKLKNN